MAIVTSVDVVESALWPQGDIRDPLGVWGARLGVTGDASGGAISVEFRVALQNTGAFVYTCYSVNIAVLTQATPTNQSGRIRLLTSWPNVDPIAGVQAYGSTKLCRIESNMTTAPLGGFTDVDPLSPSDRFLLLFDPRAGPGPTTILELSLENNDLNDTYSFEGYGYYWDRSVLNAPGGPRHPGAS